MRIEDVLFKKSIPSQKSYRYKVLKDICCEKGLWPTVKCEFCGIYLTNPQSILIHQGGFCRKNKT